MCSSVKPRPTAPKFKILETFPQVYGEPFMLKALDEKLAAMK